MCTELPSPQTLPPFAFSHPLVYAFRVQDRVDALDKFIHRELHPKISRLREEHRFIEHQLQRTMAKKSNFAGTSTIATAKQNQATRLKQQAWSWKRTSKRQELNRFEPFFELATDLQRISKELNPNILRLNVLRQRSQSIAPRKYLTADDSNDVVFDEKASGEKHDHRRQLEQRRLSREYHDAYMENVRVSKSIQKRTDKLRTNKVLVSNNTEDASIWSSLMIFSNNYIICGTCQAKFHKDYINALVVRSPIDCERNSCGSLNKSTHICIPCWNSKTSEKATPQRHETQCGKSPCLNMTSSMSADESDDQNKANEAQTTPTTERARKNNHLHETERWKTRKMVIKNRIIAATVISNHGSSRVENSAAIDATTDTIVAQDSKNEKSNTSAASTASSTIYQYIDSMPSLDDGLMRIGESLSLCTNLILGEFDQDDLRYNLPPLLHPLPPSTKSARPRNITTIKLKVNSSTFVDSNNDAKSDASTNERSISSSRFGSTSSSLCSNSIVECDPEDSLHSQNSCASLATRYRMDGPSRFGKKPLKRTNSWSRYESSDSSMCSNSIVSESSAETLKFSHLSTSFSEHFSPKYIKSAMKKTSISTSSSKNGASPTKVDGFPYVLLPSQKKNNVLFRSPLDECKFYNPMTDTRGNRTVLDTSTEIVDQIEYFCKWDTFMNAFEEQKASS